MANYLYNGVELPDINTVWTDKEKYPYAITSYFASVPCLVLLSDHGTVIREYDNEREYARHLVIESEGVRIMYLLYEDPARWERVGNESLIGEYSVTVYWSSYDILREDGTVAYAASDPIPVVTPEIDPTSMLQGWIVGRRIAGQRK